MEIYRKSQDKKKHKTINYSDYNSNYASENSKKSSNNTTSNKENLANCINNTVIQLAPYIGSLSKKPPKAFDWNNKTASEKSSNFIFILYI